MTSRTLGSMDTTTLSLGGHAQNTDRNDVRLRAEAHIKGYRGSSLRGASPNQEGSDRCPGFAFAIGLGTTQG
jgi:hypothetical protein